MHPTDLLANLPPALREYVQAQVARMAEQAERIAALESRNRFLEEQFRLAQLKRFAPSSEKYGVQGCLFNEAEQDVATLAPAPEDDEDTPEKKPGRKRGRKPLPAHLPRKRVEHDLAEADKICPCCQSALHRMGEEVSEQLDIIPATVQVLQHVRFKYACRHCDRHGEGAPIITSPMPPQPIPGSRSPAASPAPPRWRPC